jgi:iron complex transport system ATP-binding protein
VLEFQNVDFAFAAQPVLHGVSTQVGARDFACVLGKNGAGKTTLLRLAAGLLSPVSGKVTVFGGPAHRRDRGALAQRLAYVPQQYELTFPFRVLEVVLMGRYPHAPSAFALDSEADVDRARAAMARCDISELAERRFHELSGGEKRRTLLAQALCQEAELIVLDEPTAAIDPGHARAFFETLRVETARGLAVFVVTHDLNLAIRFASRLLILLERRLIADGPVAEVLASGLLERAFDLAFHSGTLPRSGAPFVVPA